MLEGEEESPAFCLHGHLSRLSLCPEHSTIQHCGQSLQPSTKPWNIGPKLQSLDELKERSPLALTRPNEGRNSIIAIDPGGQRSKVERRDPCLIALWRSRVHRSLTGHHSSRHPLPHSGILRGLTSSFHGICKGGLWGSV